MKPIPIAAAIKPKIIGRQSFDANEAVGCKADVAKLMLVAAGVSCFVVAFVENVAGADAGGILNWFVVEFVGTPVRAKVGTGVETGAVGKGVPPVD